MYIKVVYEQEVHIYKRQLTTYQALIQFVTITYPTAPTHLQLTYIDQDGDEITIASDEDVIMLQELFQDAKSIKIYVKESQLRKKEEKDLQKFVEDVNNLDIDDSRKNLKKKAKKDKFKKKMKEVLSELLPEIQSSKEDSNQTLHEKVQCNTCNQVPILGVRYKCSQCSDFDLCQKCESKSNHPHPFLKINHPGQNSLLMPKKQCSYNENFWLRDMFKFQNKVGQIKESIAELSPNREQEVYKEGCQADCQNKKQEMEQDESENKTQQLKEIFPEQDEEDIRKIVQIYSNQSIEQLTDYFVG